MNKPTTLMDALGITFKILGELKNKGIDVRLTPSRSRFISDNIEEYNKPDRLKPEYWFHCTMIVDENDTKSSKLIYSAAKKLFKLGIEFDTGGSSTCRDWELDWSFYLSNNNKNNKIKIDQMKTVEELISKWKIGRKSLKCKQHKQRLKNSNQMSRIKKVLYVSALAEIHKNVLMA